MSFTSQQVNLEVEGDRKYPVLDIVSRRIEGYRQLDRFIEALEGYRKFMRDGEIAEKEGCKIVVTI